MTSADQFKVMDPLTIEVTLPKPDKLALPNLATVYPIIINSKVANNPQGEIFGRYAKRRLVEKQTGRGA